PVDAALGRGVFADEPALDKRHHGKDARLVHVGEVLAGFDFGQVAREELILAGAEVFELNEGIFFLECRFKGVRVRRRVSGVDDELPFFLGFFDQLRVRMRLSVQKRRQQKSGAEKKQNVAAQPHRPSFHVLPGIVSPSTLMYSVESSERVRPSASMRVTFGFPLRAEKRSSTSGP